MDENQVETLVVWYLRFNGYFTTANFTVHPNFRKKPGGGEADILAVRFAHSIENPRGYNFARDKKLRVSKRIDFLIVEVKSSMSDLNESWRKPEYENINYALRWMGFTNDGRLISEISDRLYRCGEWASNEIIVRMVTCGLNGDPVLGEYYPRVLQLKLCDIIEFVKIRFTTGCNQIHRENWPSFIQEFARLSENGVDSEALLDWVLKK